MDRLRPRRLKHALIAVGGLVALLALGAVLLLPRAGSPDPSLVYSDLLEAVEAGRVETATLHPAAGRARVDLEGGARGVEIAVPPGDDGLAERLTAAGARVTVKGSSGGPPLLLTVVLLLAVAGGVVLLIRAERKRRGAASGTDMDLRRSVEVEDEERPQVAFRDVAGCEEAVDEVREFVEFLREPERFHRVGARMPSGVILHGPPGTGKTLLAKALAGEAGTAFFAVSGSDFVEQFVGVGAKRVRELFARARKAEDGAVIFIDEIDAIGRKRSAAGHGNEEREGTLNELLVQMDGFQTDRRVVVVAATNRLDTLDSALLRPGRFARQVRVDLPTREGRVEILGVHARDKPLGADVELDRLADITAGCSGADLADMLNEAAIMAAREGRAVIVQDDLEEGLLRALAGPEKKLGGLREDERRTVAAHEAGHVLCAELCPTQDKARRATIKPRGRAAGLALYGRTDRSLHDAQFIHEQLICLLGGRAAEWVTEGKVSSGAANDLQQASAIARQAVEELGLSATAGQMVASSGELSDSTRAAIDGEVERLVTEAYRAAIALLEDHGPELARLAEALVAAEDVDRAEILAAIGRDLEPRVSSPGFGQLVA